MANDVTANATAPAEVPTAGPLTIRERLAVWRGLARQRLREYLTFDSFVFKWLLAAGALLGGLGLRALGRGRKAFALWSAAHRGAYSPLASRVVERWVRSSTAAGERGAGYPRSGCAVFREYVATLASAPGTERFFNDPARLLGTRALVLKSPGENEKGVLLLNYSFAFPLFLKRFDLEQIGRRYHVVLEPSWSGYCEPDILCYSTLGFPVFVEAYEPRDAAFLRSIRSNLVPVPTSSNWWIDHRGFRPLPGASKDVDFIMVASWAPFKRHARFFAALARLRARGERPRAVLVGYRNASTLDDVYRQARYYGVADRLELYERLSPEEVNAQYNRAKVNVLWSRREGVNKAIIEGMFAGVPCVVREGFNYGHRYPYVNEQTGCFVSERDLPDRLLETARNQERFSPRDWVMENLSCQRATAILGDAIGKVAREAGESWTGGLAVKVSQLDTMRYWDEGDRQRFEPDYAFLRSALRP